MKRIADGAMAWSVIHWVSAASLSLYAVTGLVVLTSGSRLTGGWWTMTAWAVLTVSALWTMTTAVAEATVVTNAAVSGAKEMFEAWWAFAEGKASGIAFLALAVAVISGNEAQSSDRAVPAWSAWIAMVSGVASFAGWGSGEVVRGRLRKPPLGGVLSPHERVDPLVRLRIDAFSGQRNLKYPHSPVTVQRARAPWQRTAAHTFYRECSMVPSEEQDDTRPDFFTFT